jgi:branched-chain amino acid aminotransferase
MSRGAAVVWLNGELVPEQHATVPFLTAGIHYGIGVFEGIRSYATDDGAAIFRVRDHVDRLLQSARILGFRELPYEADTLIDAIKATISANELDACYIRPLVYLADGGWNLTVDGGRPRTGIAAWSWKAYLGADALDAGVRANVSSFTRHHPNVSMTKAKICGNYANSVLAKTESMRLGFDEAIMLDPDGYVAECTGENLFVVRDGTLHTPPAAGVLDGITRQSVITLARDEGYTVLETRLTRDDLYASDEVLVCGTAAEVIGLREIDFRQIGDGRTGPVTRRLQHLYRDATGGRHPRSVEWLDYVSSATAARTTGSASSAMSDVYTD